MAKLKYTIRNLRQGSNKVVVNLPTGLTIQNRKLHRACLNYTVTGGYVFDSNNSARVKLGAAPQTWPVISALKRGRDHWLAMHREIFKNNPGLKPKWHDYKPMLTVFQHPSYSDQQEYYRTEFVPVGLFDAELEHNPRGISWSVYTTEDSSSDPDDVDKDEFNAHLLGGHIGSNTYEGGPNPIQYTSIGLLESWQNSRPDISGESDITSFESTDMKNDPLNMLFNDGDADDEIIENFSNADDSSPAQDGDIFPPYHEANPVGNKIVGSTGINFFFPQPLEVAAAKCTAASPVAYFTGFQALLGQVVLDIDMESGGTIDIVFEVNPKGAKI